MTVIAFYKGTKAANDHARVFDRLVCWWPPSRGPFSHSEVVGDRRGDRQGELWRCRSSSLRDGGVRAKWLNLASGRWVLVRLPQYDSAHGLPLFARYQGAPYDVPGVLGFVLRFIKQLRAWWYCSEWCAAELAASALAQGLPAPPTDISPSGLFAWCMQQPGAQVIDVSEATTAA